MLLRRLRFQLCRVFVAPAVAVCVGLSGAAWAAWSGDPAVNNLVRFPSQSFGPWITQDGAGGTILVWKGGDIATQGVIRAQHLDASGNLRWASEGVVVRSGIYNGQVAGVFADGEGGAFIVWAENGAGEPRSRVLVQRVDGSGTLLWAASGITAGSGLVSSPQAGKSGDGGLLLVTQRDNAALHLQAVGRDGTLRWAGDGIALRPADSPGISIDARVVTDGNGGALVAWVDSALRLRRVNASGEMVWTQNVSVADSYPHLQDLAPDQEGGAYLATIESAADVLKWRRVTAAGQVMGTDAGTPVGWQGSPIARFVSAGSDGVLLVWTTIREDYGSYFNVDICARKVGREGNALWSSDAILLSRGWVQGALPSATSDGAGGAVVAWSSLPGDSAEDPFAWPTDPPITSDVRAQRVTRSGQVKWGEAGVVVCSAPDEQYRPAAAADRRGGAIVCWQDRRSRAAGHDALGLYASALLLSGGLRSAGSPVSALAPAQSIRVRADGGAYQELVYNYSTAEMSVSPYSDADGSVTWPAMPEEWTGVYHYDYAAGQFSQAGYLHRDPL